MCVYVYTYIKKYENDILNVKFWNETNSNQEIQDSGWFFGVSWHDYELKKKWKTQNFSVSRVQTLNFTGFFVSLGKKKGLMSFYA